MIGKAYDLLDSAIMYGVNKSVKGYNAVTGDTKAGLANKLIGLGAIAKSTGLILTNSALMPFSVPFCFLYMGLAHLVQKRNGRQERLEKETSDGAIPWELHSHQSYNDLSAPVFAVGGGFLSFPWGDDALDNYLFGGGHLLDSAAFYIMRAEYVPPGKSVFQKTGEKARAKLEEIAESLKRRPFTEGAGF